jgi:hypothetical protein
MPRLWVTVVPAAFDVTLMVQAPAIRKLGGSARRVTVVLPVPVTRTTSVLPVLLRRAMVLLAGMLVVIVTTSDVAEDRRMVFGLATLRRRADTTLLPLARTPKSVACSVRTRIDPSAFRNQPSS